MKIIFGLLLAFVSQSVFSQQILVRHNELLDFVYYSKSKNINISNSYNLNMFIPQENKHLTSYKQKILKNAKGLFILIEGTGRVYKALGIDKKGILFERLDSTHFYGYNASCIFFSSRDTLYSLGGGGFWEKNGQLRYYSEINNEWQIRKINKKIPTDNTHYYQDAKENFLYYLQTPYKDPGSNYEFDKYILTKLNIEKIENTELGEINKALSSLISDDNITNFINLPSLNGNMINLKFEYHYLINYEKNEVFRLVNPKIMNEIFGSSDNVTLNNTFELNKRIYYTKSNDPTYKLYSFPISMNDFVKEPYPLYEPFEDEKKSLYFYIGGLCMLLIGGSVFYVKKRKQKTISTNSKPSLAVPKKEDNGIDFNPLELELITKMIEQSARGNHFSVEDINTSLGLNRKTLEIQKKIRTETINRINHKFKIKYNLSIDLIERIRSEEDRRYYKYMISGENSRLIKN